MSTLFFLFFGLLQLCASVPDCDWAYLAGEYIALNVCQQDFKNDEFNSNPSSYTIECNDEGTGLQHRHFTQSSECNESTPSITQVLFALTIEDDFNCNIAKTICPSEFYMIYRTYECLPNSTANNTHIPYRDYNLITNTCLANHESQTSQYISCSSHSYSITTYSGTVCQDNNTIDVEIIANHDCMQVLYCYQEPTHFFTTTPVPVIPAHNCKYINYDGTGHRIDICHRNVINSELYSYKFNCSESGDVVNYNYYNTGNCDNELLFSVPVSTENVINFQCETTECSASDYMQLKIYEVDGGCSSTNLQTFSSDLDVMTEYTIHDFIVGHCLQDKDGNFCIFECNNNDNQRENGYFTVEFFDNPHCSGQGEAKAVHEIDCFNDKLTHMIWCDGINNVSYNSTTSAIIDCNYFIDEHIGHGVPLDICGDETIAGKHYSYKYKCNAQHTGIDKYTFKNKGCRQHKLERIAAQTDIEQFHCDSMHSCYDIDDHYNSVLVAKHYTNASCANKTEDFYMTDYIIVDECWPNKYDTFSKVTCTEYSYTTTLYTGSDCAETSRFVSNEYEIADVCLWDDEYREIIFCPTWMNATWSPDLLPDTSAPTAEPTSAMISAPPSTPHRALDCRWVNFNGNARRIDVCNIAPYGEVQWSYKYECKAGSNGDIVGVIQKWWRDTEICTGQADVVRDLTLQITDYNCESEYVCVDYVKIKTYDTPGCQQDENHFVVSESIIDECFMDNYNESKFIKCNENGNGYVISEYHDDYCQEQYLWKITEIPTQICQITTQRVEVMEECTSYRALTPTPTQSDINPINFTECSYFYNGLFGVPLDVCQVYKHGGKSTSITYKCNADKNKIIQYQYSDSKCSIGSEIGADETVYSLFYCGAGEAEDSSCDVMDVLKMKWYDNGSCITDEGFWGESSVIMNVCWPNFADNTSAIILCNDENYIIYRYDNIYCAHPSFAAIEYQSGKCVDGNTFTIESGCFSCNYWVSTDGYGYPINHCYQIQSDDVEEYGIYKGFEFKCNQRYDGILQIRYTNSECTEDGNIMIEVMDDSLILDIEVDDLSDIQLLTLKIYHNNQCQRDEKNWSQDIVIIDKCMRLSRGNSRMVTCSLNSFTIHMYQDPNCHHVIDETVMNSGDCDENGAKTEIISCGTTDSPTPTPTVHIPLTTSTTGQHSRETTQNTPIATVQNSQTTDLGLNPPPTTPPNKKQPNFANAINITSECRNFFGGGNVNGANCEYIEAIVWLVIAIGVVSFACCCAYFFCNATARKYCLYGRTKDLGSSEDSANFTGGYEDDDTFDHPGGVLINPMGVKHNKRNRYNKAVVISASATGPSATDTDADTDTDLDDDDDVDEDMLDPLDENEHIIMSSFTQQLSSFHAGTAPSGSNHITSSDDLRTSSSAFHRNNSGSSSINVNHAIPSHLIGQTIEIDNIPIDIMRGVDISAVRQQQFVNNDAFPPGHVPKHSDNNNESRTEALQEALQTPSEDVHGIVGHYIRNKSYFDDKDTKTSTGNTSISQPQPQPNPHVHSRHNAMDLAIKQNADINVLQYSHDAVISAWNEAKQTTQSQTREIFQRERNLSDTTIAHETGAMKSGAGHSRTDAVNDMREVHHIDAIGIDEMPNTPLLKNDANLVVLTGSIHGALSSALAYSANDEDEDDERLASLPTQSQRIHGAHHRLGDSLIDPLMTTPMSRGALVHSEDEEYDGTVTSALAHSVETIMTNQDGNRENDEDAGTVHDL